MRSLWLIVCIVLASSFPMVGPKEKVIVTRQHLMISYIDLIRLKHSNLIIYFFERLEADLPPFYNRHRQNGLVFIGFYFFLGLILLKIKNRIHKIILPIKPRPSPIILNELKAAFIIPSINTSPNPKVDLSSLNAVSKSLDNYKESLLNFQIEVITSHANIWKTLV